MGDSKKLCVEELKDVSTEERTYITDLVRHLCELENIEDKVDYLILNGVRYIGEGSYWKTLEDEFPHWVNAVVKGE